MTGATSLQNQGLAIVDPTEGAASTRVVDGEGPVTMVGCRHHGVDEGDPAIFTVILTGLVQDDVTLTYLTQDGSADAGDDYTGVPQRPGDREREQP